MLLTLGGGRARGVSLSCSMRSSSTKSAMDRWYGCKPKHFRSCLISSPLSAPSYKATSRGHPNTNYQSWFLTLRASWRTMGFSAEQCLFLQTKALSISELPPPPPQKKFTKSMSLRFLRRSGFTPRWAKSPIANRQRFWIADSNRSPFCSFAVSECLKRIANRAFRIAISNRRDASDSNRTFSNR